MCRSRRRSRCDTLIDDVVTWLAPMAQERGVRLSVSGDPFTVNGDAEQLREALNNVIANAILYNKPGGSVTISTRESGATARIEVVDTGIGIPAEAVPHVFDRFLSRRQGAIARDGRVGTRALDRAHHLRRAWRRRHVHQRARSRIDVRHFAPRIDTRPLSVFSYLTLMQPFTHFYRSSRTDSRRHWRRHVRRRVAG